MSLKTWLILMLLCCCPMAFVGVHYNIKTDQNSTIKNTIEISTNEWTELHNIVHENGAFHTYIYVIKYKGAEYLVNSAGGLVRVDSWWGNENTGKHVNVRNEMYGKMLKDLTNGLGKME